ncbi:prolyl 3-hydroxylase OGFOD1 isoform X2 [Neocloeon triangulifer]|uniref:prolyl 3-hydroxylase OGFOD1 isoform X2 n=1 Tax=Neocloeon triangulifer TaxID=2078957 RepID=UPI00286F296C|nr:prolyl 3-hydroxylase OGFOD1 isoform X2 [Neocloeon triangulifer]
MSESEKGVKRPKGQKGTACKKKAMKFEPFTLNQVFSNCTEKLAQNWESNEDCAVAKDNDCEANPQIRLFNSPFKHCVVDNFVDGENFLSDLKYELSDLNYTLKNNDLFQFHQSDAFDLVELPHVAAFKQVLYEDVRQWLVEVTKLPLTNRCDTFCSRYEHTDYLLCHDDRCSTRKIAFIYYLNKNWKEGDGGTLDLFDSDENSQPRDLVKSIQPNWNRFLFFEVSEKSHHQVSELVNQDKIRVAISGWYHVASAPECDKTIPICPVENGLTALQSLVPLDKFINPVYLQEDYVASIQQHFEQTSEAQLHNFVIPECYQDLSEAFLDSNVQWEITGPPNIRHYQRAEKTSLPARLQEFLELMHSQSMFKLLASMTGLDLLEERDPDVEEQPSCHSEVQQWSQGCYTLLVSPLHANNLEVLDVYVHFNSEVFPEDVGGTISYIANTRRGAHEVLNLRPAANSMSMVYAGRSVDRTVKYLNSRYEYGFHTIQLRYYVLRRSTQMPTSPSSDSGSCSESSMP